jgi:MFS family permease
MPTTLLSGTTAAATFGLIMSVAQTGGFFGPLMVGRINDHFRSVRPSIFFIACSMFCSATILAAAKIGVSASSPQLAGSAASAAGFQRDHVIPEIEIQAGWLSS